MGPSCGQHSDQEMERATSPLASVTVKDSVCSKMSQECSDAYAPWCVPPGAPVHFCSSHTSRVRRLCPVPGPWLFPGGSHQGHRHQQSQVTCAMSAFLVAAPQGGACRAPSPAHDPEQELRQRCNQQQVLSLISAALEGPRSPRPCVCPEGLNWCTWSVSVGHLDVWSL